LRPEATESLRGKEGRDKREKREETKEREREGDDELAVCSRSLASTKE
jgi:hypothetical protein